MKLQIQSISHRLRAEAFEWTVVLAIGNGRVIGSLSINETGKDIPYVACFAIAPRFRKKGIGSAMLEFCKSHLKAKRRDGLNLWVHTKNTAAIRFYKRHGFKFVMNADPGTGTRAMFLPLK